MEWRCRSGRWWIVIYIVHCTRAEETFPQPEGTNHTFLNISTYNCISQLGKHVQYSIIWDTRSMVMQHFHDMSLSGLSTKRHPNVDWKWSLSISRMPLCGSTFFALGKAVVLKELSHCQISCGCPKSDLRRYVSPMLYHTDELKQSWGQGIIHWILIQAAFKLLSCVCLTEATLPPVSLCSATQWVVRRHFAYTVEGRGAILLPPNYTKHQSTMKYGIRLGSGLCFPTPSPIVNPTPFRSHAICTPSR